MGVARIKDRLGNLHLIGLYRGECHHSRRLSTIYGAKQTFVERIYLLMIIASFY